MNCITGDFSAKNLKVLQSSCVDITCNNPILYETQ